PGVKYRHLILTVPEALRPLIYQHPKELLDGLMKAAQAAMDEAMATAKRQPIKAGYIVVLQTAGRAATYNPHLHVLMTDGGLTREGAWQELGYIAYDVLHRKWQAHVLGLVETRLAGNAQARQVVTEMRQRYPKGFVAHWQGDVLPRLSQLTRYIVKYVVSPPMALSRIIHYDRERGEVTYWYRDHLSRGKKTETVSRETFIGRMVQHILPKGFQRIRYYGLQATCTLKKVREQLAVAMPGAAQLARAVIAPVKRLTYRERLKTTLGCDPQVCPKCGAEMWLWKIWHPKYGVLYDEGERLWQEAEAEHERRTLIPFGRSGADHAGGSDHLQLSLFAMSP
ncbi:MAG TPA: transposase, partial [Anaerolineales bacterium]|nr:transposase [Anaerolineales bacterium]